MISQIDKNAPVVFLDTASCSVKPKDTATS